MASKRRGPYRHHPLAQKRAIVEETLQPGASVAQIARKHGVNANQVFLWRKIYREQHFGFKPERSWQEAIVRYLEVKATLKSYRDVQRICRNLHPYLGGLMLNHINGDVVWSIIQGEMKKGNKPATINRYLSLLRNLLRTARDEWQWIDSIPKVRLLLGEVERDRWLTREEADRLLAVTVRPPPSFRVNRNQAAAA